MTMSNGAGGHRPVDGEAVDVVTRIKGELQEAITAEQLGRMEYERLVSDSRVREDRLKRSLKALEGAAKRGRPSNAEVARRETMRYSSPKQQARTLAVLRAHNRPMTVAEVQEALGAGSRETARKALEALRGNDQVRLAGTVPSPNGRTPSNTYALMPGADNAP
jgi:hypothetical protein